MAKLLQVHCLNCTHCCAALHLTQEALENIQKENKEIYDGLMELTIVCVFCQRMEILMPMKLLQ